MSSRSARDENSQSVVKSRVIGVKINGTETDRVLNEYSDRLFIVLSQYKKFGSLIAVCKESANIKNGYSEGYQVRTILGQEEPAFNLAARYLTEQTQMTKPVLYSICLKDCSLWILEAIKDIILQNKMW
jgi:hypothetical protein